MDKRYGMVDGEGPGEYTPDPVCVRCNRPIDHNSISVFIRVGLYAPKCKPGEMVSFPSEYREYSGKRIGPLHGPGSMMPCLEQATLPLMLYEYRVFKYTGREWEMSELDPYVIWVASHKPQDDNSTGEV